jgi:hypothetical protein
LGVDKGKWECIIAPLEKKGGGMKKEVAESDLQELVNEAIRGGMTISEISRHLYTTPKILMRYMRGDFGALPFRRYRFMVGRLLVILGKNRVLFDDELSTKIKQRLERGDNNNRIALKLGVTRQYIGYLIRNGCGGVPITRYRYFINCLF